MKLITEGRRDRNRRDGIEIERRIQSRLASAESLKAASWPEYDPQNDSDTRYQSRRSEPLPVVMGLNDRGSGSSWLEPGR